MKPSDWNKFASSYSAAFKPGLPPERNLVAAAVDLNRRADKMVAQSIGFGPASTPALREIISGFRGLAPLQPVYFGSSHDDGTQLPMIASSHDGVAWTRLNLTYTPPPGDGCRDCSITYYRGRFWMAYTAGSFGAAAYFGIAVSDDLVNWTHHTNVTVPTTDVNFTWAPEWLIVGDTVHIFYSKSYAGVWRIHSVTATDDTLTNWTPNGILAGQSGIGEIDASVIRYDGEWIMASRNYGGGGNNGIKIYRSNAASPLAGWFVESVVLESGEKEGCSLVNMGDGRLRMYFVTLPPASVVQSFSDSFDGGRTWGAVTPITGNFPAHHATVLAFLPNAYAAANQTPRPLGIIVSDAPALPRDIPVSKAALWKDSVTGATELAINDAGLIRSLPLDLDKPLVEWDFSLWDGSGTLASSGAHANTLTITGAASAGAHAIFDGTDYAIAASKAMTDRIHQGKDFKLILEGPSLSTLASGFRVLLATATTSFANTGFYLYQQDNGLVFGGVGAGAVSINPTGTIIRIIISRKGSVVRIRADNTAGNSYAGVGTITAQTGTSGDFLQVARGASGSASNSNPLISRIRLYGALPPSEAGTLVGAFKCDTYADDSTADADTDLLSGQFYRTTAGGRAVFRKP